ncbi:hypothetical protein ANCDUO_03367 [Ancylostoma duodenale]|uniref:Secreted protein n=1 Tax=Ancylostoma duodenale TaxID=51022 RepID=A0A0C2DU22_9BILA|nr:hypothetical protein ANCDUO_03367 [Ancylostoma duodenale]
MGTTVRLHALVVVSATTNCCATRSVPTPTPATTSDHETDANFCRQPPHRHDSSHRPLQPPPPTNHSSHSHQPSTPTRSASQPCSPMLRRYIVVVCM